MDYSIIFKIKKGKTIDSNNPLLELTATNIGRRNLIISSMGISSMKLNQLSFLGEKYDLPKEVISLDSHSIEVNLKKEVIEKLKIILKEDISNIIIVSIWAEDKTGKVYKKIIKKNLDEFIADASSKKYRFN